MFPYITPLNISWSSLTINHCLCLRTNDLIYRFVVMFHYFPQTPRAQRLQSRYSMTATHPMCRSYWRTNGVPECSKFTGLVSRLRSVRRRTPLLAIILFRWTPGLQVKATDLFSLILLKNRSFCYSTRGTKVSSCWFFCYCLHWRFF